MTNTNKESEDYPEDEELVLDFLDPTERQKRINTPKRVCPGCYLWVPAIEIDVGTTGKCKSCS